TVGLAVGAFAVSPQSAVAGKEERRAFPEQPLGAVLRGSEVDGAVGPAVAVLIDQDADVAAARDDDPAAGIDGQTEDVVGEFAVGELGDLEAVRHAQAVEFTTKTQRREKQHPGNGEREATTAGTHGDLVGRRSDGPGPWIVRAFVPRPHLPGRRQVTRV